VGPRAGHGQVGHRQQVGLRVRVREGRGGLLRGATGVVQGLGGGAERRRLCVVPRQVGQDPPGIGLVGGLERIRHAKVQRGPRRRRHLAGDRVADQRVRELVRELWPVDHLEHPGRDERVHPCGDLRLGQVRSGPQDAQLEAVARHGEELGQATDRDLEAAQAPSHHLAHAVGDTRAVERALHDPAVHPSLQQPGGDQVAPELAEEERVAAAPLRERGGELSQAAVEGLARRLLDQGRDVVGVQTAHPQPTDRLEAAQARQRHRQGIPDLAGRVPEGRDHEHPPGRAHLREVVEQGERVGAGPVHVVEDDHQRPPPGRRGEQRVDRHEHAVALGLGIDDRVRRSEPDSAALESREQGRDQPEVVDQLGVEVVDREGSQKVVEDVHPRLVGHGELGVTAAVQHGPAVLVAAAGELGGQAGLAGPRLTADEHDAPVALLDHRPPGVGQGRRLGLAPDHPDTGGRGEGGGQRHHRGPVALGRRRLPGDDEGLDGVGQALQLERAEGLERRGRPLPSEPSNDLGDQDLTTLRGRLEPSRGHDRQAVAVARLPAHVAGRDPDPHPQALVGPGNGPLDVDRSHDGVRRGLERGHHTVSRCLHHAPAASVDHGAQSPLVIPEQPIRRRLPDLRPQLGRALDVREEDRRRGRRHSQT
jgi:hypothetical protein